MSSMTQPQPQYRTCKRTVYTTGQIAAICRVAPRTVSKWIDTQQLRGYRIPGSNDRRVTHPHLVAFLHKHSMPLGHLDSVVYILVLSQDATVIDALKACDPNWAVTTAANAFDAGLAIGMTAFKIVVGDCTEGREIILQTLAAAQKTINLPMTVILANEDETTVVALNQQHALVVKRPFNPTATAQLIHTRFAMYQEASEG